MFPVVDVMSRSPIGKRCSALAVLICCAFPAQPLQAASCSLERLVGSWQPAWRDELWHFGEDGSLLCDGPCTYGPDVGYPTGWGDAPEANAFSRPYDYLKLIFSAKRFEGVLGSYRCQIDKQGRLVLEPMAGDTLRFTRQEKLSP